jgi:spore germination protein KC
MMSKSSQTVTGYIVLVLISTLLLTGCWDRHEIQDRSFVLAVAIDLADEGLEHSTKLETFAQGGTPKPLRLSLQVLSLAPQTRGENKPSKTYVISNTGRSMHEMLRDANGQNSKPLWFEHIQSIIISEAAVRKFGLTPLIDLFRRDAEVRWRTKIYITPQDARKFLDFVPPTGEAGGIFIGNISRQMKDLHIAGTNTDLGATSVRLDNKVDVVLPAIELSDKQVKVNAMAVFKKDKFVEYWDEYTVKGAKLLLGIEKAALIAFQCPLHPDETVVFEMFQQDTTVTPHIEGEQISFTIDIAMRGNISEISCSGDHDATDKTFMDKSEALFAQEVQRNIEHSLRVMQNAGVDDAGFGRILKAYEPKTWEKIKDRWDEVFPTIPLTTHVRVSLQNTGEHK